MITSLDTLETAKRLKEAGFSEPQAEALSGLLRDVQEAEQGQLATKADLGAIDAKIERVAAELDAKIERVAAELRAGIRPRSVRNGGPTARFDDSAGQHDCRRNGGAARRKVLWLRGQIATAKGGPDAGYADQIRSCCRDRLYRAAGVGGWHAGLRNQKFRPRRGHPVLFHEREQRCLGHRGKREHGRRRRPADAIGGACSRVAAFRQSNRTPPRQARQPQLRSPRGAIFAGERPRGSASPREECSNRVDGRTGQTHSARTPNPGNGESQDSRKQQYKICQVEREARIGPIFVEERVTWYPKRRLNPP